MWRRRTNQELRELYKNLDIVADIKTEVTGMDWTFSKEGSGRRVGKVLESKPEGSRRRGRPRLRWMEDLEKDLADMKVKRRRQKAVDKEEWASIIKEAKALRDP